MLKGLRKITALILTALLIFSIPVSAEEFPAEGITESEMTPELAVDYFEQAVHIIMSRYKFDVSREEIYKAAIEHMLTENPQLLEEVFSGMFDSLDKYSTYYTEEELNDFIGSMSGEVCGIGVMVTTVDTGLLITNVYENSPAMDSGLMIGDIITKSDGTPLAGMDISIAQSHVAGEAGTNVTLTIVRGTTEFTITATRRRVVVSTGFYQMIENKTMGYICLTEFDEHADQLVQGALTTFDANGINKVIVDLRSNPGGVLKTMVDICSLFIPEGPAIILEYKNPLRNVVLYSENTFPKYELIVLVNENSASASEAFAAAVQDTGVGIVVGKNSFGKGSMQNIINFKTGGGAKLTEAEFLSPAGRQINGVGVGPDVVCEDKIVPYDRSGFAPVTYDRILKNGDSGKDVLALEERLDALGFSVGFPDEIFDAKTYTAVLNFQKVTNLYPYGVADITTQLKLEEVLNGSEILRNDSLKKAIDIFKNHDWREFITVYEQPAAPVQ